MTSDPLGKGEFDRMWRVLDMSITGHSVLRDRYQRRERAITLAMMALSILAVSLAFLNGEPEVTLFGQKAKLATWLGSLTAGIFFLALLDALVDWKRSAWAHEDAALRLSELKSKFRGVTIVDDLAEAGDLDLRAEYEATMENVAVIPESMFLALKTKHRRKVAVSRLIDDHPGAPLPLVRLLAVWRGIRGQSSSRDGHGPAKDPPSLSLHD